MNPQQSSGTAAISLLYWRKNLWNGAQCVPVILQLDDDGQFTMRTADKATVFSVQLKEVQPRFTGWGTMILRISDKTYDLVGAGGTLSPSPAQWQLDTLRNPADAATSEGAIAGSAGVGAAELGSATGLGAAGTAAAVGGVAASQVAFHRGLSRMRDWQNIFSDAGLSFRRSSMRYMAIYVGVVVGLLIVFALIGFTRQVMGLHS